MLKRIILDPLDNLNWLEQSADSSTYDINAIPTKCPVGNQSLVYGPGSPPNLHLLEAGCEYKIVYSLRCVLPGGKTINSNKVEHRETACTGALKIPVGFAANDVCSSFDCINLV